MCSFAFAHPEGMLLKISCKECFVHDCEKTFSYMNEHFFTIIHSRSICMLTKSALIETKKWFPKRRRCCYCLAQHFGFKCTFKECGEAAFKRTVEYIIMLQLKYQPSIRRGNPNSYSKCINKLGSRICLRLESQVGYNVAMWFYRLARQESK